MRLFGEAPVDFLRPAVDQAERKRLWWQVVAIIAIAVAPFVFTALYALFTPAGRRSHLSHDLSLLWRSLCDIVAVIAILRAGGERLESIGLLRLRWRDTVMAVVSWALFFGLWTVIASALYRLDEARPEATEYVGPRIWPLWVLAESANGAAEEIAIWGLLYTRLRRLMYDSEMPAIAIAAGCFASYHIYQGGQSMFAMFLCAVVASGAMFRITGRLWPLIFAHAAHDLIWGY